MDKQKLIKKGTKYIVVGIFLSLLIYLLSAIGVCNMSFLRWKSEMTAIEQVASISFFSLVILYWISNWKDI